MIPESVFERTFEFAIDASIGGADVIPEADFTRAEIQDAMLGNGRLAFLEQKFKLPIVNAATGTNEALFGPDAEMTRDHMSEIVSTYVSGFYVGAIATGLHHCPVTVDILANSDPQKIIQRIACDLDEMSKGSAAQTIPGTHFPSGYMATRLKPALFAAPLVASYFKSVLGTEPDASMLDICMEVSYELISVFAYGAAYAMAAAQINSNERIAAE